jgi:hypothetical protein
MKDTPFSLDTLSEVPKIVKKNSFLTKLDDKSGYDNVLMSENSKSLLGFQWAGHYFQYNTLTGKRSVLHKTVQIHKIYT